MEQAHQIASNVNQLGVAGVCALVAFVFGYGMYRLITYMLQANAETVASLREEVAVREKAMSENRDMVLKIAEQFAANNQRMNDTIERNTRAFEAVTSAMARCDQKRSS